MVIDLRNIEISQLVWSIANEDIGAFHISMQNWVSMQGKETWQDLIGSFPNFFFRKMLSSLSEAHYFLEQISFI